jgi:phosphatidylserine/phosphatidylglycerophosphate/cardiolipin synthase-like enzyme
LLPLDFAPIILSLLSRCAPLALILGFLEESSASQLPVRFLSSPRFRLAALFLLGLLVCLSLAWRSPSPPAISLLPPLPQDPNIQAYFNHSQSTLYTDPYRHQKRLGDDLEQVVIDTIATAQSTIDIAVHEISLPRIATALKERHQAGVQVRVIVENSYSRPRSRLTEPEVKALDEHDRKKYDEFLQLADRNQDGEVDDAEAEQGDAIAILQSAKVPLIDDTADGSKGSGLMHHKFLVIDGKTLIVGSANFSLSDIHGDFLAPASQGNANHLLKISNAQLAQKFTQEFNILWGTRSSPPIFGVKKPYRPPYTVKLAPNSTITVQFSPTSKRLGWDKSVNGLIERGISTAKRSVDLMLFVFSEQTLGDRLEQVKSRGVQVRALVEPQFFSRDYSETLDMLGVALKGQKCRYEENNRVWRSPITTVGMPDLPEGDLLHHKVGIVDQHLVITGSQNWSDAANHDNDENLLLIDNAIVAAHFKREFDRLYKGAFLGVPSSVQKKIKEEKARCRG